MTNFERIKVLTIDEMAEYIVSDLDGCTYCIYEGEPLTRGSKCLKNACEEGVKAWLNMDSRYLTRGNDKIFVANAMRPNDDDPEEVPW